MLRALPCSQPLCDTFARGNQKVKGVATNQAHGVHCVMSGGVHLPDSVASVCRRVLSSWSVKSREPLVSHTRTVGAIQDPVNDSRKCKPVVTRKNECRAQDGGGLWVKWTAHQAIEAASGSQKDMSQIQH